MGLRWDSWRPSGASARRRPHSGDLKEEKATRRWERPFQAEGRRGACPPATQYCLVGNGPWCMANQTGHSLGHPGHINESSIPGPKLRRQL